jgi:hypothetical protein
VLAQRKLGAFDCDALARALKQSSAQHQIPLRFPSGAPGKRRRRRAKFDRRKRPKKWGLDFDESSDWDESYRRNTAHSRRMNEGELAHWHIRTVFRDNRIAGQSLY